jgi:hypothetical protein
LVAPVRSSAKGVPGWVRHTLLLSERKSRCVKTGLGVGHHSAWKRSAIVTDVDWVGKAYQMFARMTPGEVKVYGLGQLEDAKSWVAA